MAKEKVKKEKVKKERNIYKRIINIVFVIIILMLIMISIDVISVSRYGKGPYFAIPLKTYEEGTKEYYGLGYKVIKYNQIQGRRDKEIGLWTLKYNTKPIDLDDVDLAIAFRKDEEKAYKKYYKKFLRVKSTLKEIDEKKNIVTIGYTDEDGKYTMDIICTLVPEQTNIVAFEKNKKITVIGTVNNYKGSTKKENKKLYIKNCIAQQ